MNSEVIMMWKLWKWFQWMFILVMCLMTKRNKKTRKEETINHRKYPITAIYQLHQVTMENFIVVLHFKRAREKHDHPNNKSSTSLLSEMYRRQSFTQRHSLGTPNTIMRSTTAQIEYILLVTCQQSKISDWTKRNSTQTAFSFNTHTTRKY